MGKYNRLFAEESIGKLLFRVSIPIIISFLITELYGLVDTLFIGRAVGALGIGALSVVFPVERIINAMSIMISVGASTALARANGEENTEEARNAIKNGFSLTLVSVVAISILIYLFSKPILTALGARNQIFDYATIYLNGIIISMIFLSITIYIANIMVSLGKNNVSIVSTTIGLVVNAFVNYILISKLNMGVKGAAISTAISHFMGFIYAYIQYTKVKKEYKIGSGLKIDKRWVISIIVIGFSSFIIESDDGFLTGILNNLLLSTMGEQGIVILGIVSKVYVFFFITIFGIASAMQPIASFNIGAKNYKRLKTVMTKTTIYAFITSLIMWVGAMIFTPQLISIFLEDKSIINEAVKAFRIMMALLPISSIYYVSIFYFQAMGRAKISIILAILKQTVILMPVAVILVKVFNMGALGVWIAYPISDILVSIASYMLIREEDYQLGIKVEKQKEREKIKAYAVQ